MNQRRAILNLFYSPLVAHSYILILFSFSLLTPITLSTIDPRFQACEPKTCGNNQNISYPFYIKGKQEPFCGYPGFELTCDDNNAFPIITTSSSSEPYIVDEIFYDNQTFRVSIPTFSKPKTNYNNQCIPRKIPEFSQYSRRFFVAPNQKQVQLFYGCDSTTLPEGLKENIVGCDDGNKTSSSVVVALYSEVVDINLSLIITKNYCKSDYVVNTSVVDENGGGIKEALKRGFLLIWNASNCDGCMNSGGRCGFDPEPIVYAFRCYCPDGDHPATCEEVVVIRWWIWLIIGVGVALSTPAIFYLSCTLWRKYKAKVKRRMLKKNLLHEIGDSAMLSMVYGKTRRRKNKEKTSNGVEIFNFETIVIATNNFSTANKLGEGGFGPVYKGTLSDKQEIAIKRLSKSSGQGLIEFKNEANVVAKLQHTNLVKLLGFCIERDERILVYEYMLNKSLDFYLFDSSRKNLLDWKKRMNIIGGIAQGLLYLHKYSRIKVIHRDLKASNILLDEEMNPKISDFGMARIFGLRGTEENTNRVVGTYGYMSPEYAMNGVVSIKTDVFSFGVLLLEILSSKKNNSRYHPDRPLNLIGYAWQLWNDDGALDLIDPSLIESCNKNEVVRCVHIGLLCVQDQARDRPTMLEIVSFLSNDTIKLHQPKQPAFFINVDESELPNSRQEYHTLNDVTISSMHGR